MKRRAINPQRGRAAAATLLAFLLGGVAQPALAQASGAPATETAADAPDTDEDSANTVAELVVNAPLNQPLPGAAVGDIQPDIQLSPAEIQSYGVSSVADLLSALSPQLGSNRGRGGEAPVVLLNGRRISGFREVRDLPTEAIMRVDILPEEAALAYGYSADQRVINFVLRRRFEAITAEVGGGGPTAGGQTQTSAELSQVRIRGDNRLNLVLKAQTASALTEDERDLVSSSSGARPFDLNGNITGAMLGGEIDPALSALVGGPVTVAGLPAQAAGGQPLMLGDLGPTAGMANVSDIGRYRSLAAETQEASVNAVLARALPNDFRGTLTGGFEATRSDSLRGLPGASLLVPAGNAFSPFGSDVTLNRYVDGFGPLRRTTEGWTGEVGGSLNRDIDKWRFSLTGGYNHGVSLTHSDAGVDISALQAATDAGTGGSPFAAWPLALLAEQGRDKAQSVSDALNLQGVASGEVFSVPAGPVRSSIKLGETADWLSSRSLRSGVESETDLSRNTLSAQGSLDVPLTSRKRDVLPFLGELSVNANGAVSELSDFGTLTTVGFGANWRPITGVSLIVSQSRDEGAPTTSQLGGPVVATEAARIFDYVTGQTVEVRRLDGGQPGLSGNDRSVTKFGLTLKPISSQDLTLSASYVRSRIDNPITTFPAVTAEIEAAFPDRFVRDASGNLTQVDYRPVNFAESRSESLRWGVNYSRPFGPQPERRLTRPRPPEGAEPEASSADARPGGGTRAEPGADQASGGSSGAPSGGRDPGGGGRGGGGPGGGGRLQFAVYHTVYFENELLVAPGGPVLDVLNGAAAGSSGGQPRHLVEAQAGVSRNGLGARLSANWQSATTVLGGPASTTGDLNFSSLATVSLRLFANLGANRELVAEQPWLRGSRVSLSVTNLFDAHQNVRDQTGATPIGYRPDELDPLGRVVSLNFRKLFF